MRIYIGSDHRGFRLKEKVAKWLFDWGYKFEDMGAESYNEKDDYTLYAERVASMISDKDRDKPRGGERGILLCGSGVGVDIVANKFDGVRASIGKSAKQIKSGRKHDDMNVLVIAADYTNEDQTKKMIEAFLKTKFDKKPRHKKRIEDIKRIEENN
jgi:ribose 5-phosphate isomerase B